MKIQMTRIGTIADHAPTELAALRAEFHRRNFLQFPNFIEPQLLEFFLSRIEVAPFALGTDEGIGSEDCMNDAVTAGLLVLLTNDRKLHEVVEQVTGCDRIGSFEGRVYRMVPGAGHSDSWHDDLVDTRVAALSVNLSREPYSGGDLQIRRRSSGQILECIRNAELGQAVLFRLSNELEHCVAPVEGRLPRTAFAGWFKAQPDFQSVTKQHLSAIRSGTHS
jgi:hypothetical protein